MIGGAPPAKTGLERQPGGWSGGMVDWLTEPAVSQRLQFLGAHFMLDDLRQYQSNCAIARIIRQFQSERSRPAFIAWVILLGLSGRYPTSTQVHGIAGAISLGRFSWALRSALELSRDSKARRRVLTPASSLVVDVTKLSSQETISGIPRVTLALAREAVSRGGQAVVWDSGGPAPVSISSEGEVEFPSEIWARPQRRRRQLVRAYLGLLESLSDRPRAFLMFAVLARALLKLGIRWTQASREPGELLLLSGGHYVESEIPSEEVADQLGLCNVIGTGMTLSVFVHDFLPVTHPQFFDDVSMREHLALTGLLLESDFVYVATQDLAEKVRFATALKDNNVSIEASVVPLPMPLPSAPSAEAGRNKPYFLVMGGFGPRKGLTSFLDYLAMCGHNPERFGIRVVGFPRPSRNRASLDLFQRLRRLGVDVSFNPSDTELAELMEKSVGVVYPSFAEGYGFPVLEASYLGKPVICRPIPSNISLETMFGGRIVYWDDHSKNTYNTMVKLAKGEQSAVIARTPGRIPIPTDTQAWATNILVTGANHFFASPKYRD